MPRFDMQPRWPEIMQSLPEFTRTLGKESRDFTEMMNRRDLELEDWLGDNTGGGGTAFTPKSAIFINTGFAPISVADSTYTSITYDFVDGDAIAVPSTLGAGLDVLALGAYLIDFYVAWDFSGVGFRRSYISMGRVVGAATYSGIPTQGHNEPGMASGLTAPDSAQEITVSGGAICDPRPGQGAITLVAQNTGGPLTLQLALLRITQVA